jgi:hypothetical protein
MAPAGLVGFLPEPAVMGAPLDRPATRLEVAIGRTLAVCVHPIAAWRTRPVYRPLLLFSGCLTASYILVFLALQFLSPLSP